MALNIRNPEAQALASEVAPPSGRSITASVEGEPLLFKGSDFPLTDIPPA